VSSLVADAAAILFDSPLKSTQLGDHIEACVIERRESALNGDEERWVGACFSSTFIYCRVIYGRLTALLQLELFGGV
jgi:hypothetical protein